MSSPYKNKKAKTKKIKVKSYNKVTYDIQKATNALNPLGGTREGAGPNPTPLVVKKKRTSKKPKKSKKN